MTTLKPHWRDIAEKTERVVKGMGQVETKIVEREGGAKGLEVVMGGRTFTLPFKLIGGRQVGFLDISGQVSLIESAADELAQKLLDAGVEFDTILNPVSKSNALAHAVALRWSKAKGVEFSKTVVARKSTSPAKVEATYRSVTTPVDQTISLTDGDVEFLRGKKILVMDDVYGGGGTTEALKELARKAEAHIAAFAVIGVEQGVTPPENLYSLFVLPVLD